MQRHIVGMDVIHAGLSYLSMMTPRTHNIRDISKCPRVHGVLAASLLPKTRVGLVSVADLTQKIVVLCRVGSL